MKGEAIKMNVLQTIDVIKSYGKDNTKVTALNKVNLTIGEGEFVSIVGASGSGKSTLLHMLGGVDQPTQGEVLIKGNPLSKMSETQLATFRRQHIGLVYQFFNLIPTLNVRDNILLPLLLDKRKPDHKKLNEIISMLGLEERLNHYPSQLSGGQQQRVAIARSLIVEPSIILADEPTGNLDKKNSKSVLNFLKESNKSYNQTIILITHDEEIALSADRMITIEDGSIVGDEVLKS